MKPFIIYITVAFWLASCGQKVIIEKKEKINNPWMYSNVVTFEYSITDTTKAYDLILKVEHSSLFSFENLYLNTTTIFPDTSKISAPLSLQLADATGNWLGDCRSDYCLTEIYMSSSAYFKKAGNYTLMFEQYSRKDSLEGILSLTLKVVESEN